MYILNHSPRHLSSELWFVSSSASAKFCWGLFCSMFSSLHPLHEVMLYSTSILSAEAIFLVDTFCTIYFPFKLRTFSFLSFLRACLHPLQKSPFSSFSVSYLYSWGMSSISSFYVFTLLPFGATNPKPTSNGCVFILSSNKKCVWNVFPCHENSVLTMLFPRGLLI